MYVHRMRWVVSCEVRARCPRKPIPRPRGETEPAEARALQRRAAKASPPRDTAFMHSSTPYVAPRPVSYRPEAKGLPRWNV